MISRFLYRAYAFRNNRWRALIRHAVTRLGSGQMESLTLRKIFRDYHDVKVGLYSYGCFNPERVPSGTCIGRYCSFARNFSLISGNNPLKFKSLHPYFYNPVFGFVDELKIERTQLTIENDVWVGTNATVLPSVQFIASGAVIGACSVVTKDVPPYAVVVGNPAKVIKYRFSQEKINEILAMKWWERSILELKMDTELFAGFVRPFE